jgi:hypothetical protein
MAKKTPPKKDVCKDGQYCWAFTQWTRIINAVLGPKDEDGLRVEFRVTDLGRSFVYFKYCPFCGGVF